MNFLVVDFEFSMKMRYGSPRAWFQEIIEVGAVAADERGNITGNKYSAFVKPRFWPRLANECYGTTGIRQQDVDGGIPIEEAINQLTAMSSGKDTWLVAWGDADRRILGNVCDKYGLEYPFVWDQYVDLAEEYRLFFKLDKKASLKRAIEETGVEQVGILHSAMDDAINAALVMKIMLATGWAAVPAPTEEQSVNG